MRYVRVYYKELEYNSISVLNSLVSTSSFISYIFGILLFGPILEAKFNPIANNFVSRGANIAYKSTPAFCNLNWEILPQILISVILN